MSLYILDSDHLSLYQRGHKTLYPYLSSIPPEQMAITIISVEELLRGRLAQVRRAATPQTRIRAYEWLSETIDFISNFTVLQYNAQADAYFEAFRAQKIRIGTQDLRIAAITLSHQAILVTRNRRDFEIIPTLKIEDWSGSTP
jgi:tRNA(fMet)-specific endonuclease VapC